MQVLPWDGDTAATMSRHNVEIVQRIYAGWLSNEPALEALDPEIELHPDREAWWVGVDQVYRGVAGLGEYLRTVYEAFEDYHPEIQDFLEVGDKVVTLAVESGRGRTSGAEVKAWWTAHVWTLRDGKAVRLDLYLDRDRALEAVGLREPA